MKTPDKIYLNKYMICHGMLYPAQYPADTPEFEYIRKDTLLEWAKEKANDYKGTANIRRSFEMMIRKIESL